MRSFTEQERMQRVWDVYEIKNLMARHAYYHAYDMHDVEIDTLWVKKPENQATASFGQNWGYQVGMDLIRENYVTKNRLNRKKTLAAIRAADPTVADTPENYAIGTMLMHCLTSPYVEVAGDGQTAQGMWYAPGQVTGTDETGSHGGYMYEKYGVDFIKEDGEWKIWHLFIGTDFSLKPGTLMTEQPVDTPKFDLNDEDEETNLKLTYEFEAYTSRYNWTAYPIIPTPYETFADTVSNGPEGNPYFPGRDSK